MEDLGSGRKCDTARALESQAVGTGPSSARGKPDEREDQVQDKEASKNRFDPQTVIARINRPKDLEESRGRKQMENELVTSELNVEPMTRQAIMAALIEKRKRVAEKEVTTGGSPELDSILEPKVNEPEPKSNLTPENTAIFFACKNESFPLRKDYRLLSKKLKKPYGLNTLQLQEEIGEGGSLPPCALIILAGLQKPLLSRELTLLTDYVEGGGRVMVLAEGSCNAGIYNSFTKQFGITIMKDTVVRVCRFKTYLPKECFVDEAMICPTLMKPNEGGLPDNLNILYPSGCTLEACRDAKPLVSSGLSCYPSGRPLGAIYTNKKTNGRLLVLGSAQIFTDAYIDLEQNPTFLTFFIELLINREVLALESIDIDDCHLKDYDVVQATENKSKCYRGMMQDTDEFIFAGSANTMGTIEPKRLISSEFTHAGYRLLPDVVQAYEQLNLERDPLAEFIKPQFDTGMPGPKLAVFPPKFRDLKGPPLELFDLDEEFSSPDVQLGRIINKCSEDDLEYCIEALGDLLSVPKDPGAPVGTDKHKAILHMMASQLMKFKLDQMDNDDSMRSDDNEPALIPIRLRERPKS